jgi:TRAP-type mannitol/chloroaromatic compound transport system substrate-binding protein
VNQDLLAEYTARNPAALQTLLDEHGVDMRPYPDDVLIGLRRISREVVAELADRDAFSRRVYASYSRFYEQSLKWTRISELAYLQARERA